MASDYSQTLEAADRHCLRAGEAATLLAGHPWRRMVVIGDSIAEGVSDPTPGYHPLPLADRVHAELAAVAPSMVYLNLGRRNLRTHEIRRDQIGPALAFAPDLAMVVCGANDAMRPGYEARADAVDEDLAAMVTTLQEHDILVVTVAIFAMPEYPGVVSWLAPAFSRRMRELAGRTGVVAATLGTIHVDLSTHPAIAESQLTGVDGLHGNGRSQAIAAAQTIRALGAYLRTHSTAGSPAGGPRRSSA